MRSACIIIIITVIKDLSPCRRLPRVNQTRFSLEEREVLLFSLAEGCWLAIAGLTSLFSGFPKKGPFSVKVRTEP